MAKEIDKIIQSKTAPKSNNVLWDDGENLKINRNGKWENANKNAGGEIDPVVWKYLCNPAYVSNGMVIPNELLKIVDNEVVLKYKVRNIYDVDGRIYEIFGRNIVMTPINNVVPIYYIEEDVGPETPGSLGGYVWRYREDEEA